MNSPSETMTPAGRKVLVKGIWRWVTIDPEADAQRAAERAARNRVALAQMREGNATPNERLGALVREAKAATLTIKAPSPAPRRKHRRGRNLGEKCKTCGIEPRLVGRGLCANCERVRSRERKKTGTCIECGTAIDRSATRCQAHANALRRLPRREAA